LVFVAFLFDVQH